MRVIDELISYLWRNNKLSAEDIHWLSNHDYCDIWNFHDGDDFYWERMREHDQDDHETEDEFDNWDSGPRRPRKNSGAPTEAKSLIADLTTRLAARREASTDTLGGLARLAPDTGESLEAAASHVANAETSAIAQAIANVIAGADDGLSAVARIAVGNYIHVEPEDRPGPAWRAYRKLIASRDIDAIGKYNWILKEPEIATAYTLARAQMRIADALGELIEHDPQKIARPLIPFDVDSFWFLCLLLTAKRAGRSDYRAPGVIAPRPHALPDLDDLYRLIDLALGAVGDGKKQNVLEDAAHPLAPLIIAWFHWSRFSPKPRTMKELRAAKRAAIDGLSAFDTWDRTYRPPDVFDEWK
ncbi:hypothetical protein [Hyphococcus sp.]|uniref:hypothetical protein n=1 Tax=Hyphococcus sp. TaxID=2038636 RepID=UPI0035C74019